MTLSTAVNAGTDGDCQTTRPSEAILRLFDRRMPLAQSRPVRTLIPTSREASALFMPCSSSSKNLGRAGEGRRPPRERRPTDSAMLQLLTFSGVATTPRTQDHGGGLRFLRFRSWRDSRFARQGQHRFPSQIDSHQTVAGHDMQAVGILEGDQVHRVLCQVGRDVKLAGRIAGFEDRAVGRVLRTATAG